MHLCTCFSFENKTSRFDVKEAAKMNFLFRSMNCTLCGGGRASTPWTSVRLTNNCGGFGGTGSTTAHSGSSRISSSSGTLGHDNESQSAADKIRNIGLVAHIDAGKTTTTERMLFYAGSSRRLGEVDDGNTITDYMEQERARGITITSAAVTFAWRHHRINLIDTPGHVDFTMEVERSLRVLDGAVAILDASAGVQAQTLTVWRQADRYSVPRIVYLNKMDKKMADVRLCLQSIANKFRVKPLAIHLPIGCPNSSFAGIVDLPAMDKVMWPAASNASDFGRTYLRRELSESESQEAHFARGQLIEDLADMDDRMADLLLSCDGGESFVDIAEDEIKSAIRRVTIERKAIPVLCGSSYKNVGVQPLLDAVVDYLPSPLDRQRGSTEPQADKNCGQLCALVFKICHDKRMGRLAFVRIYAGKLEHGCRVRNLASRTRASDSIERPTRLLRAFADEFRPIAEATAGDIVVLAGTKNVVTGDTLVSHTASSSSHCDQLLAGVQVPPPVFFCSIEAASLSHQKPMEAALEQLSVEDPSLGVRFDDDTGQIVLSGLGELHMEIVKDRLLKEHKVQADFGPLRVAYREVVVESPSDGFEHAFDRTVGSSHQRGRLRMALDFAKVTITDGHREQPPSPPLDPSIRMARTKDNQENLDRVRPEHVTALESGLRSALSNGPILGCPVTNVQSVALHWFDVSSGGRGSTTLIAAVASQCVDRLLRLSKVSLAEPLMLLEIVMVTSTDKVSSLGPVLADLATRRGRILDVSDRGRSHSSTAAVGDGHGGGANVVRALVPLAELVNYSTALRTITSGTATFTIEFRSYDLMNERDQEVAVGRAKGFL